ncbi:MAG: TetR/AcrR family transcriptional regulator [Burkholderiaceae bacterium]
MPSSPASVPLRKPVASTAVASARRTVAAPARRAKTEADRAPAVDGSGLHKGQQTKAAIVRAALEQATRVGLEGLSIGALAERMQMSKSGVFAHFGSREELQIAVIHEYFHQFEHEVFLPVMQLPRGLPRVRALFANWMKRVAQEIQSGCIFISGAVEFDDRPGPVRDALANAVSTWLDALRRAVVQAGQEGHLHGAAEGHQMAFEIHGLILALHYEARFLHKPGALARAHAGFAHVLARYGQTQPGHAPNAALRAAQGTSHTERVKRAASSSRLA